MKSYSEKLKDPRWQKKRLEVMQRDKFACKWCGDKETELHVHHKKYTGEPWDAPKKDLETVCKWCHEIITDYSKDHIIYNIDKRSNGHVVFMCEISENDLKKAWVVLYRHEEGGSIDITRMQIGFMEDCIKKMEMYGKKIH